MVAMVVLAPTVDLGTGPPNQFWALSRSTKHLKDLLNAKCVLPLLEAFLLDLPKSPLPDLHPGPLPDPLPGPLPNHLLSPTWLLQGCAQLPHLDQFLNNPDVLIPECPPTRFPSSNNLEFPNNSNPFLTNNNQGLSRDNPANNRPKIPEFPNFPNNNLLRTPDFPSNNLLKTQDKMYKIPDFPNNNLQDKVDFLNNN